VTANNVFPRNVVFEVGNAVDLPLDPNAAAPFDLILW
jgi:hypothetical protein